MNPTTCHSCGRVQCHCEPFALIPQSAQGRKRVTFDDSDRTKQRRLFSGSDCIEGQTELFNPDGKEP